MIDFKRRKRDIAAEVTAIEYDPNRTAASLCSSTRTARRAYILAPDGLDGRRDK